MVGLIDDLSEDLLGYYAREQELASSGRVQRVNEEERRSWELAVKLDADLELCPELFATLEDLRDPDKPMEIERAQAIAGIAQVIVNSAKVENDHIKLTGRVGSGFIESAITTERRQERVASRPG